MTPKLKPLSREEMEKLGIYKPGSPKPQGPGKLIQSSTTVEDHRRAMQETQNLTGFSGEDLGDLRG